MFSDVLSHYQLQNLRVMLIKQSLIFFFGAWRVHGFRLPAYTLAICLLEARGSGKKGASTRRLIAQVRLCPGSASRLEKAG